MNQAPASVDMPLKPRSYRLKKWLQLILIVESAHLFLRLLNLTLRYRFVGKQHMLAGRAHHPQGLMAYACWHESIITSMLSIRRDRVVVIVSSSHEGEMAVRVSKRFGVECVRGSSTRGGSVAIIECGKRLAQGENIGVTVDGPRGPRRVPKPGVVGIASRYGVAILPFYTSADRYWVLKSWDKFRIPKPFSTVTVAYGEPIVVPSQLSHEEFDHYLLILKARLEDLEVAVTANHGKAYEG